MENLDEFVFGAVREGDEGGGKDGGKSVAREGHETGSEYSPTPTRKPTQPQITSRLVCNNDCRPRPSAMPAQMRNIVHEARK